MHDLVDTKRKPIIKPVLLVPGVENSFTYSIANGFDLDQVTSPYSSMEFWHLFYFGHNIHTLIEIIWIN